MPLYRPTELKAWLAEHGLSPKKGLSQNFLIDGNIVQKIARLAKLESWQRVIEIGPGPGVLTEQLIKYPVPITAIETDANLAALLQRFSSVEVVEQNALHIPWPDFLSSRLKADQKAIIVSNLPYHLSSDLLRNLLPLGQYVGCLILMVQKEFAQRLRARVGDPGYGPLSIFQEHYSQITDHFDVPNQSFYPRPAVRSTVLKIQLHQPAEYSAKFEKFIEILFAHRRKSIQGIMHLSSLIVEPRWREFRAEQLNYQQLIEAFTTASF